MSGQRYTPEFKDEAVKLITERGYSVTDVAERLGVSQHSIYKWLSEGNITIGGQATTTTALGINSNVNTANTAVEILPNLQEILDKQKTVADATSTIAAASRTYAQNQVKNATAEKKLSKFQLKGI